MDRHAFRSVLFLITALIYTGNASPRSSTEHKNNEWFKLGVEQLKQRIAVKRNDKPADNVILFIGDGMGLSTLTAARIRAGQLKKMSGEENFLSFEKFPWVALCKTYGADSQVSDSANTATAILTGIKSNFGTVGVNDRVKRDNCSTYAKEHHAIPLTRLAEDAGMSTGIVTNMRITHATPASTYAHSASRNWEADSDMKDLMNCQQPDIAKQFVELPGKGFRVVLGGGRKMLTPNTTADPEQPLKKGERTDGRNLIKEWLKKYDKSQYVWNATAFSAVDPEKTEYLLGLFEPSQMKYEADRMSDTAGEPSLEEMTEKAIKILKKNPKGFFLVVEGGLVDYGHHDNNAYRALSETIMLSKAVKKAQELVNTDSTLIIVTADHSHQFTIGGYAYRGNPILGVDKRGKEQIKPNDNKDFTTLLYGSGPGGIDGTREDPQNTEDLDYKQQAVVKSKYSAHGGEDVGAFAQGPQSHLFNGIVDQNYIYHVMHHALCLGDNKDVSCDKPTIRGGGGVKMAQSGTFIILTSFISFLLN